MTPPHTTYPVQPKEKHFISPHYDLYKCVVCNRIYKKLPESKFTGVDGCCRPGSFIEIDHLEASKTILEEFGYKLKDESNGDKI
jgi:hypothetical protein